MPQSGSTFGAPRCADRTRDGSAPGVRQVCTGRGGARAPEPGHALTVGRCPEPEAGGGRPSFEKASGALKIPCGRPISCHSWTGRHGGRESAPCCVREWGEGAGRTRTKTSSPSPLRDSQMHAARCKHSLHTLFTEHTQHSFAAGGTRTLGTQFSAHTVQVSHIGASATWLLHTDETQTHFCATCPVVPSSTSCASLAAACAGWGAVPMRLADCGLCGRVMFFWPVLCSSSGCLHRC